jgi:hypothetical protein
MNVQAATKKMATESNGKYLYYSVYNTIYRMDTNTGKSKKIKTVPKIFTISDISYYNGYLYFESEYYEGTDGGSKPYICRIKTNGTSFKKLGCGKSPKIYNSKIYYIRGSMGTVYGEPEMTCLGIARMKLNGDSKKTLLKSDTINAFQIVKNRIYYIDDDWLLSMNMSGNDGKYFLSGVCQLLSDGTHIYYTTSTNLYQLTRSDKSANELLKLSYKETGYNIETYTTILAVKNGNIYLSNSSSYNKSTLKKYNISKKKMTKLKTFKSYIYSMYVGKGSYALIHKSISGSTRYTDVIGRIKTNGKNYKDLQKFSLA